MLTTLEGALRINITHHIMIKEKLRDGRRININSVEYKALLNKGKARNEISPDSDLFQHNMNSGQRLQEHSARNFDTLGGHPAQVVTEQRGDGVADIVRQANTA